MGVEAKKHVQCAPGGTGVRGAGVFVSRVAAQQPVQIDEKRCDMITFTFFKNKFCRVVLKFL